MVLFSRAVLLLVFVAAGVVPSYAQTNITSLPVESKTSETNNKKFQANLLSSSRYLGYEEGVEEEQLVQLTLSPLVQLELTPWFNIDARATINLNSGRVQSRFADNSTNTITLDKLEFNLNPWGPLYLKAGAIDQSFLGTELLIQARAFPGAMAGVFHQWEKFQFNLSAQQAIPSSVSLESDRREDEDQATFTTYGARATWTPHKTIALSANLNFFEFKDLPSVVARDSNLLGNSVNGGFQSDSQFRYGFRGLAQAYKINFKATSWLEPLAELQIVENQEAPSVSNRGQWIGAGAILKFKDFDITPFAAHFYNEANSTPAVYNSAILGSNNREGMLYRLKTDFKKYGFFVEGQYVQADLLQPKNPQNDMNSVSLMIGIANELF